MPAPINIPIPAPQVRTLYDVLAQKRAEQGVQALQRGQEALQTAQAGLAQAQSVGALTPKADDFQTADTKQLLTDMNNINNTAADVKENDIPLYTQLKAAVAHVPTGTGPLQGQILWATPEGQYLKSLLVRAQGNYIKNFHLGRMTQREFDLLRSAVGGGTTYSSALQKIFDRQLSQDKQALIKQHYYNQYINQGGRSSTEAANKWLKTLGGVQQQEQKTKEDTPPTDKASSLSAQLYSKTLNRPVSEADIQDTMKANNLTRQQVLNKYGITS